MGKLVLWTIVSSFVMTIPLANGALLKDPTKPTADKIGQSIGQIKVGAIVVGQARKFAMINGRRFQAGDIVDGMKIDEIRPGYIVLSHAQKGRIVVKPTATVQSTHMSVKKVKGK